MTKTQTNNLRLVSIRGGTTVSNDANSITERVSELIEDILAFNKLDNNSIVNIIISTTSDITAVYPAKIIRESGITAPLFSTLEPPIDNALPLCVRVMVTAYSALTDIKHVYLYGARTLRKDLCELNITIDGPSGAGKSTVAKAVAKQLEITYLDTGALYRALGLKALNTSTQIIDGEKIDKMLADTNVEIKYDNGVQNVILDGQNVSTQIRQHEVSKAASDISALASVRKKLLKLQRSIAAERSVIMDGRDTGTVILPNADFKFFLTASSSVRATRRHNELKAKGDSPSYEQILKDIEARDYNDSHRKNAPLMQAADSILINSDNMTIDDVVNFIVGKVKGTV